MAVMREVRRVLRDDGTVWLNLGDAYAGSGKGHSDDVNPGISKSYSRCGDTRLAVKDDLPPKNLMGQPWRIAFALQDDGWILRSAIVWHKPNPMPESTRDRPTSSYEMIFLLTKSGSPSFWTHRDLPGQRTAPTPDYRWRDALTGIEYTDEPDAYTEGMIPCPDCGGGGGITVQAGQVSLFDGVPSLVMECDKCKGEGEIKRWKRTNLWQSHDYFYDAEAVRVDSKRAGDIAGGKRSFEGQPNPFSGEVPSTANSRNVWQIPTQGRPDAHFATFPDELPRRCILAGTSEHGVCGECGAPWTRRTVESQTTTRPNSRDNPCKSVGNSRQSNMHGSRVYNEIQTLGWQPTCSCNADSAPATVLDPFVGSGTSCAVGQSLGRRSVGLDLNPEYLAIAAKRIGGVTLQLEAEPEPVVETVIEEPQEEERIE